MATTRESKRRPRSRRGLVLRILLLVLLAIISVQIGSYFYVGEPTPQPTLKRLEAPAMRVLSLNVRLPSGDSGNGWDVRRDLIAATIRNYEADIVGTQEAYLNMASDLGERLPGYDWYGVGSNGGDSGAANPIFWRESRFTLQSSETFWLSKTPQEPSQNWDAAYPRTVTHVELLDEQTGRTLHVFNSHFDHRGREAKVHSAALVAQRVNALPQDARVIMMGDLNSVPDSNALNKLESASQLKSAFDISQTEHFGPTFTYVGFRPNRWTGRRIDHIYVQNLVVQKHGIMSGGYGGRPQPSDHYPVMAEILVK